MAHASPEIESVARQAAEQIADVVMQMLMAGHTGEVAVVIRGDSLQVEKRPVIKKRAIPLRLGHWTEVKRMR